MGHVVANEEVNFPDASGRQDGLSNWPGQPHRADIASMLVRRDDGIYVSTERFRGKLTDAHLQAALASRDVLLLTPAGDAYLPPRAFALAFGEQFAERAAREGLPDACAVRWNRDVAPAVIVRTSRHTFVPGNGFADRRVPSAFTAEAIFVQDHADGRMTGAFTCLAALQAHPDRMADQLTAVQWNLIGRDPALRTSTDACTVGATRSGDWPGRGPDRLGGRSLRH